MPDRTTSASRSTAQFYADDDAKMKKEYSRVSTALVQPRTKDRKGQRSYPGYEDYSAAGRAQIKAFNEAGGAEYLNDDTDAREYEAAALHALNARNKSGTKQEPSRGRPRTRREELEVQYDRAMKAGK